MPIPTGDYMVCRDCGERLHLDKFSRNGRKDGFRRPECRSCQHKRNKKINPRYQKTPGHVDNVSAHRVALSRGDIKLLKIQKIREQDGECNYCDTKLYISNCDLDHITPLSRGGSNKENNFQALCGRCNKEKHSKDHNEYIKWLIVVGEFNKTNRAKLKKYL